MSTWQTVAAVIAALGGGATLRELIGTTVGWLRGRQQEEQTAWEYGDRQAVARRKLEEYAGLLRRMLIEQGVAYRDVPPWPRYRLTNKQEESDG